MLMDPPPLRIQESDGSCVSTPTHSLPYLKHPLVVPQAARCHFSAGTLPAHVARQPSRPHCLPPIPRPHGVDKGVRGSSVCQPCGDREGAGAHPSADEVLYRVRRRGAPQVGGWERGDCPCCTRRRAWERGEGEVCCSERQDCRAACVALIQRCKLVASCAGEDRGVRSPVSAARVVIIIVIPEYLNGR